MTKKHGGSTNAFTATEGTNYYFDVNADCFEEALDRLMPYSFCHGVNFPCSSYMISLKSIFCGFWFRFAQFFIKPLMSADATTREIKAVDSG